MKHFKNILTILICNLLFAFLISVSYNLLQPNKGITTTTQATPVFFKEIAGKYDNFYIEYEHGAHTLVSDNSYWTIIDRGTEEQCINAISILSNTSTEGLTSKGIWNKYNNVLYTEQIIINGI